MNRTMLLLATTGAAALGAALVAPAPAQADDYPPPPGSYQKSCSNIHYRDTEHYLLAANCRPKDSSAAAPESRLDTSGCEVGSIGNDNGRLACKFSAAIKERTDASRVYKPFMSAADIILGQHNGQNVQTLVKWVQFARAHNLFVAEIADHTLDFGQAAKILQAWLRTDASAQDRREVYNAAYQQVYGTPPGIIVAGTTYDAEMKAGKAWYATIVVALRAAKNAPPAPKPTNVPPPPPIG